MREIGIGLLGCGTVGASVLGLLQANGQLIQARAGCKLVVRAIAVRNPKKTRDICMPDSIEVSDDWRTVVGRDDVDIVCELMGGVDPAYEVALLAIRTGKHFVTANKALLAKHGEQIFSLARKHGVTVHFEASVAGGIPVIRAVKESLSGNHIKRIVGILNGTSNFILSRMEEEQCDFDTALLEAQNQGYAEADPEFDISGVDAAQKLAILSYLSFGLFVSYEKIYTEGIQHITKSDLVYADQLGYAIKHLAIAYHKDTSQIALHVFPALISQQDLLADVNGVKNAVVIEGDAVGELLFYGDGAGGSPTASSVVGDLVMVAAQCMDKDSNSILTPLILHDKNHLTLYPMASLEMPYYLRMHVLNRPGVLADVTKILGDLGISIESIFQTESVEQSMDDTESVPIILLTHVVQESLIQKALIQLTALSVVLSSITMIRVEHRFNK